MYINLTGSITPITPLTTNPVKLEYDPAAREKYSAGSSDTSRLPRLKKPINDQLIYVPYFPASGIRGVYRRAARDVLHEFSTGWAIDELRYIEIGGVKGSAKEGVIDIDAGHKLRERLPLISLFGATTDLDQHWVGGKLGCDFAIPVEPIQPDICAGVRKDPARDRNVLTFLSTEAASMLEGLADMERQAALLRQDIRKTKRTAAKNKRDGKPEDEGLQDIITEAEKQLAALDEKIGVDVSVQMPLSGYEYFPPEIPLKHGFSLNNITLEELGLFLETMRYFAYHPYLGAHYNHGCGQVRAEYSVKMSEKLRAKREWAGSIKIVPFEGIEIEGGELNALAEKALNAWDKHNQDMGRKGITERLAA